jgi:hypothetical protein
LDAIKKAHPGEKINEGTFKATFYKLSGDGRKKRTVRKRRPTRGAVSGGDRANATMRAGLAFVRIAGSVRNAQEQLVGLKALIETAKAVDC